MALRHSPLASGDQFEKKKAKFSTNSIWFRISILIIGSAIFSRKHILEVNAASIPGPGIDDSNGMDDSRKWSSVVGLWGKRSSPLEDEHQLSPILRSAFVDAQQVRRLFHLPF